MDIFLSNPHRFNSEGIY